MKFTDKNVNKGFKNTKISISHIGYFLMLKIFLVNCISLLIPFQDIVSVSLNRLNAFLFFKEILEI